MTLDFQTLKKKKNQYMTRLTYLVPTESYTIISYFDI